METRNRKPETGKRLIMLAAVGVLAVLGVLIYLAAFHREARYYVVYGAFDTEISLTAKTASAKKFDAACFALEDLIRELNAEFDLHHGYQDINNVKTINDCAGRREVVISRTLMDLLLFAKDTCAETYGAVDISIGPITTLWREAVRTGAVPSVYELKYEGFYTGIEKLELDEGAMTAYLNQEGAALDVGAVGKGYAAQKSAEMLTEYLDNFIINAGGSIVCYGKDEYSVGVANPWAADGFYGPGGEDPVFAVLSAANKSVVTSGDYERFFIADGERYSHIIDPATLYPAKRYRSVTIIADDSSVADVLSTALFVLDEQTGRELLKKYGADALWIYPDRSVYYTDGVKLR